MNVLLSLPDEVVIPILGEWLCVKNVRSLDTAMCQRHPREDFLTVLSKSVMSNDELRTAFLRDKTLEWVVQKKLRYADISIFWKKLDSRIEVICAILANQGLALRSLRYYGNRNMDSNCPHLYTVLNHCTNLESLFVERVLFESDNVALSRFSQANSTLKRLHLLECGGINTTNCAALCAHLSHLEGIDLRLSDVDDACIPVIMERCPKLWSLELFGCSGITDTGALAIAQHGAKLVHISISDTRATEVGAAAVAASSPNLKDINLERVQFRSPSLAASIARSCPLLENLSFVGCGAITDVVLIAIAENCTRLKHLFLNECYNFTETGLYALAAQRGALRYISITDVVGHRYRAAVKAFRKGVRVHLEKSDGAAELVPVEEEGIEPGALVGDVPDVLAEMVEEEQP